MEVIGLTGGIATGKSTVSKQLATRGIPVIDADVLAREVVRPGTRALKKIVSTFGPEILQEDGTLNRAKLGAIVFNDGVKRRQLNAIVHPAVRWEMAMGVLKCWLRGEKVCVLDVPLLIESKIYQWVGKVVVIYWSVFLIAQPCARMPLMTTYYPYPRDRGSSAEIQLQRLMQRDKSTRDAARARLQAQLPIAEKLAYADIVIDNSGTQAELEVQVESFARRLHLEAGWSWRLKWLIPPLGLFSAIWTLIWRHVKYSRQEERLG
ncbi:CoaE-domain-containing protein [Multifurca ochricompacta]|uniref:CoaE-domain-containing protein n=1 Tax=Multifurca ochricompacta TaxID=376703 RepID=A0AAD4LZN7_9AGAM|nr:CoaE-domain-containing protein [Multifurca ochricompacta]